MMMLDHCIHQIHLYNFTIEVYLKTTSYGRKNLGFVDRGTAEKA